jgi:hypothetical protein
LAILLLPGKANVHSRFSASSLGAFEMKAGKISRVYGLSFCVEFNEKGEEVWIRCRGDENPAK